MATGRRGLPGTFWALFVGVLLMALATFVFPFLALFLQSRHYTAGQIGLMAALFGAGSIPAGPVAGWLADHVGRRPALLASLISAAVVTALLPFLTHPALLALGTLALGLAVHAYYPVANAIVADVVPPDRFDDAFGLMYWERNAGIAVSFAVGGSLVAFGFERLFLADAASTALFVLVVLWKIPETRPAARPVERAAASSPPRGFAVAFADVHFRRLQLLAVAQFVGLFQFMVALPVVMTRQGLSAAEYGQTMAVNGVLITLLSPWLGRVTKSLDPGRTLAAGATLVAAGYGAYTFCASQLHYILATAVWSLGEIITIPVITSLVARLSPVDLRGRYQGLFSTSFGVALALAPAIGGWAVEGLGARGLWAVVVGLCTTVAFGHLLAGRARVRAGVG